MNKGVVAYNESQSKEDEETCTFLANIVDFELQGSENKIWHGHPVWFLEGNPVVGYSKLKGGVRLMFWSGASFDEPELKVGTGKFKDASITYVSESQINKKDVIRWLKKSKVIQWDYKNIVKRKGEFVRLK